jgi:alpha-L-rhamnosidase
MSVSIAQLSVEHHHDGFGIFSPSPRVSWRFGSTTLKGWTQASYDIVISRSGKEESYHIESAKSVLVPWPSSPLLSREIAIIKVLSTGKDGSATGWATLTVEAALLERSDWTAKLISAPRQSNDEPKRPFRLRKTFTCSQEGPARLYATAHGLYQVEINGTAVGDQVLAPGWQSYKHRLHYQEYDITSLLKKGDNVLGATIGEGWFAGRIGRPGTPNIWGDRLGFLAQLEVGGRVMCVTDDSWEYLDGPIIASEIYDGEIIDTTLIDQNWSTTSYLASAKGKAEELPFPSAELISPDVAPVKRIIEIKPKKIITTPKGKKVLDFGQNLVGWLRIENDIPGKKGDELLIKHAEVMEHEELGTRPLRTAKARDIIKLGGKTKGYEPSFTFHGFRYNHCRFWSQSSLLANTYLQIRRDNRL